MSYPAATAWVNAKNAANYLGHNNWQLPASPNVDPTCPFTCFLAVSEENRVSLAATNWREARRALR
jgi:hypothetical protein